jgi:hypothetical protein
MLKALCFVILNITNDEIDTIMVRSKYNFLGRCSLFSGLVVQFSGRSKKTIPTNSQKPYKKDEFRKTMKT